MEVLLHPLRGQRRPGASAGAPQDALPTRVQGLHPPAAARERLQVGQVVREGLRGAGAVETGGSGVRKDVKRWLKARTGVESDKGVWKGNTVNFRC